MLLRLVPPTPLPTILFTLAFPALPHALPLPAAWDAHLQLLADTRLPNPPSLHALDKAVAWTVLLDSVTFDLATLTVTCVFVDGAREEWPLTNRCVDLLESVIRDVNRSALEAEREAQPERTAEDEPAPAPPAEEPAPAPAPTPKPKKRRSLIASLMASLVSSPPPSTQLPPPPQSPPPPPSPPPSPPAPLDEPLPTTLPPSRFLRRRARSTLVDAFRRFVLPPQAPAPFALWLARSTARRAAAEMAHILDDALCADNDDAASEGSSVHTPRDGHDPAPKPVLSADAYAAYTALRTLHHGAHDLARRLDAHAAAQAQAAARELEVLEVRSRRRAWSAGVYCGGKGAGAGALGMGVPVRSSPLCKVWTPEQPPVLRRARSEGAGKERQRYVVPGVKAREAEDLDPGRAFDGTRVGCFEVGEEDENDRRESGGENDRDKDGSAESAGGDDEEEEEEEFPLDPVRGTRLLDLTRPKSPPSLPPRPSSPPLLMHPPWPTPQPSLISAV